MSVDELDRELPEGMRRIVDEARDAAPRVDWEKLEARLFDGDGELREDLPAPAAAPRARPARWIAVVSLAAAAAVGGLWINAHPTPRAPVATTTTPAPTTTAATTLAQTTRAPLMLLGHDHEGRALHVGDAIDVVAIDGEWIQSAGRLKAHASSGTKLKLLEDGDRMRFALDAGEITADVTPVPGGEPYAIDVDGRRVAVHGTRLSVARHDGVVEVAVAEGVAAIGPQAAGRTIGPEVHAGMIGRFVGAGVPTLRTDPVEAARRVSRGLSASTNPAGTVALVAPTQPGKLPVPVSPASPAPTVLAPVAATTAPIANGVAPASTSAVANANDAVPEPGLGAAEYGPTLWKLQQAVKSCTPHSDTGVPFSFEVTMTVVVRPSGEIGSLTFDPQLSPDLDACVKKATASAIQFPPAARPTTISRDLSLGTAR